MHNVLVFLKKLTFLQEELFVNFFTIQYLVILNVPQYTILCLQAILSVYPIFNTNIHLSTF